MMPSVDPREDARKGRGRATGIITVLTIAASGFLSGTRFNGWSWLLWLISATVIVVMTSISVRRVGGRLGRRARDGRGTDGSAGSIGHGQDDVPAAPATAKPRPLRMASRMMPRPAGRRWLAEAESLLSEITLARRRAAIRSYLLSAPRLALMMWAHEVMQRARLGPRRPG